MRAGICSLQQSLTHEAAIVVKQALHLARRRGHAQVTPLHVASAMLATSTSLLKRACLQSHSHPLQCKALELCFNVALNRLPACTSSPLLGPHSTHPSLSNALVAAFKRAQAHQRRGSVENQQQPILALKIEIEQLIISILDDPSVSRVMREAGFSSTQVKNKVEQAVSLEICSQSPPVSSHPKESTKPQLVFANEPKPLLPISNFGVTLKRPVDQIRTDDVMCVLNTLVTKRRNIVIVGECVATSEGVMRGVIDKLERGHVSGDLRFVHYINVPLFYLRNLSKEDVEQKFVELRCLVKSNISRGVVVYLGDLQWVCDFWASYGEKRRNYFCSVEHIIMELKRLMSGFAETGRFWLMGTATFQTYMKCKTGNPSLESIWQLHPVTIPADGLSLSLNLTSDLQTNPTTKIAKDGYTWPLLEPKIDQNRVRCEDFSINFNKEASSIPSKDSSATLPSWLQQFKEERQTNKITNQEIIHVKDLCKKWNSFDSSVHKQLQSPTSSTSISSHDHKHPNWAPIFEPIVFPKEHHFWVSESNGEGCEQLTKDSKPDLLSNPNSSPNSASSSEAMEDTDGLWGFKEFTEENLKILCDALEKNVPWHREIIPGIASTILQCRSGVKRGKNNWRHREGKEETWLFFSGLDSKAKEKIARELAKVVFGSQSNFVSLGPSNFSSTRADPAEDSKNKRTRNEMGSSYLERFGEALNENPHRVFFMEDVEQIDQSSQKGIKQAIERGKMKLPGGENVPFKDAIIIFSCESFGSLSKACSPTRSQKTGQNEERDDNDNGNLEDRGTCVSLDLNIAIGDDHSAGDVSILESVDGQVVFKIQQL